MTKRVALVTGATSQDGAYLTEFLLNKGYVVHGIKRRSSPFNTSRVDHLYQDPHEKNVRFSGVDEKGRDAESGRVLIEVDRRYFRPAEVDVLIGDASKARLVVGWQHKVSFDELVAEMVAADLKTVADKTSRQLRSHD